MCVCVHGTCALFSHLHHDNAQSQPSVLFVFIPDSISPQRAAAVSLTAVTHLMLQFPHFILYVI